MLAPIMADDALKELGERLRQTREAKKLKQAAWCRLVDIGQQAWNNYEKGRSRIGVDQALKVCAFTGVSLDWIYRGIRKDLPDDLRAYLNGAERRR